MLSVFRRDYGVAMSDVMFCEIVRIHRRTPWPVCESRGALGHTESGWSYQANRRMSGSLFAFSRSLFMIFYVSSALYRTRGVLLLTPPLTRVALDMSDSLPETPFPTRMMGCGGLPCVCHLYAMSLTFHQIEGNSLNTRC